MRFGRHARYVSLLLTIQFAVLAVSFAETVTLTVSQNEEAPSVAVDMSRAIEDELLSRFFDAGQIVSNTDLRLDGSKFSTELNYGVKEAAFGYSDYLVAVNLRYGPTVKTDEQKKISWAELIGLEWRVVRVARAIVVDEKTLEVAALGITDFDPYQRSRIVADEVSKRALAAIGKDRGEKIK